MENKGISYDMGTHTLSVPMSLFATNRKRLVTELQNKSVSQNSYVVMEGGKEQAQYSSDTEYVFRQESYFQWCFGVTEAGCQGAIEVSTGRTILFVPRLPEVYEVWQGKIHPPTHFAEKYGVEECYYTDEIKSVLDGKNVSEIHTLKGVNTDSGSTTEAAFFEGISDFKVNTEVLFEVITELRVIKTEAELEVLRFANRVSSEAHKEIMRRIRPGWFEYQAESLFKYWCYTFGGCRHVSYTCIGASGENGAVLHYGHAGAPNDKLIRDGDMCLFDMGGEYYCYASDITCSFPVNGKFTEMQKNIYNAVLNSNRAVQAALKPGVSWVDMHLLADRVHLEELVKIGLIQGDVDEMMKVRLGALFMPHGLGHFMGHDVHDVGGYSEGTPERSSEAGLRSLRTARTMQKGMVITTEPGIYFNETTITKAYDNPEWNKFLVKSEIDKYMNFGGVRIEDDVVITDTGIENLTKVPREIEEIESLMAEGRKLAYVPNLLPDVQKQS